MSEQWIVLLHTGTAHIAYGPMDARQADVFAKWLSLTVDPAVPLKLNSPLGEMLGWWSNEYERNECTAGADCPVHPEGTHYAPVKP